MKTILMSLITIALTAAALGQQGEMYSWDYHKFGLSVKAGPAIPAGDFANEFGTGFTGFVEVPYNLAKGFKIYAGVGLTRFSADNDKLASLIAQEGKSVTSNIDAPYWLFPVVLGLNVSYQYAHIWPYFTFSGGVYFQKLETSGSYTVNGIVTTLSPSTQSWTQGAYSVGLGTFIPIGDEGWAVDLNAKFNSVIDYEGRVIVTQPSGNSVTTRAIKYVSILAGLNYTFH